MRFIDNPPPEQSERGFLRPDYFAHGPMDFFGAGQSFRTGIKFARSCGHSHLVGRYRRLTASVPPGRSRGVSVKFRCYLYIETNPTTQRIAELNDRCRKAMGVAGLVFTQGIAALPLAAQSAIREKVELFDEFTEDNDPHGERDFGALHLLENRLL
jgi:hypothetical protein